MATAAELKARLKKLLDSQLGEEKPSIGAAAAQGFSEQAINNLLGIPEFLAKGAGSLSNVVRAAHGSETQPIPENLLGLPSGRDVASGIDAGVGGLLGIDGDFGNFSERFKAEQQRRAGVEEARPIAASVGDVGADIATILTGRLPLVKGPGGLFDDAINAKIDERVKTLKKLAKSTGKKTGFKATERRILNSEVFRDLSRAVGRGAESGLEGFSLAVLQQGDPIQTAALASGTQIASSLGLTAAEGAATAPAKALGLKPTGLQGRALGLVASAGMFAGMLQIFKEATPGGRDRILESEETGYAKVAGALLLGLTAAAIGGKRSKEKGVLATLPKFADAMAAIPRAAMISNLEDVAASDEGTGEIIDRIFTSFDKLNEKQVDVLTKGFQEGDLVSRINDLIENDESFRSFAEAPHEKLINVPVNK